MNGNDNIQNELKELDSILLGVANINVYTVPGGYFEAALKDIIQAVYEPQSFKEDISSVPAGYFEGLANVIMNKIKSGSQEEDLSFYENSSLLSSVKGINVYSILPGYFEGLADRILDKAKAGDEAEESVLLSTLKGIHVYNIPAGYFEGLADRILHKVTEGVEEEGSALLSSIKSVNVYRTPADYFEGLTTDIIAKLPQQAKIIEMKRSSSIFKYAAAAVVSGIIGLTAISVLNKKDVNGNFTSANNIMAQANTILKTNSFDKVLSTVSDNDIVSYLENNGEDVDAALVAAVSEDKNLPEQVDYLTDDKTLDDLLNGLMSDQSATN